MQRKSDDHFLQLGTGEKSQNQFKICVRHATVNILKENRKRKLLDLFCLGNSFTDLRNSMTKPLRPDHSWPVRGPLASDFETFYKAATAEPGWNWKTNRQVGQGNR